jgi:hypothetical protein
MYQGRWRTGQVEGVFWGWAFLAFCLECCSGLHGPQLPLGESHARQTTQMKRKQYYIVCVIFLLHNKMYNGSRYPERVVSVAESGAHGAFGGDFQTTNRAANSRSKVMWRFEW